MALAINNLQYGTANVTSGAADIAITAVTDNKTLVFAWMRGSLVSHQNHMGTVILASTTQIQWRDYNLSQSYVIDWYAVEFTADSDITVQRGGPTTINTYPADITISNVGDTAKAFILSFIKDTGTLLGSGQFNTHELTSTTNLRYNMGGTGQTQYASWQVAHTSAAFSVQRISKSFASGSTEDTATMTSVTTGKTFLIGSGYSDNTTTQGQHLAIVHINDATTLHYEKYATGVAWETITQVISLTDGTVTQDVVEVYSGTYTDVTTALVQARTFPMMASCSEWMSWSTETGDDAGEFKVSPRWTSSTNVRCEKDASLDDAKMVLQLIEIPAAAAGGQPMMRRWGGVTGMGGKVGWP